MSHQSIIIKIIIDIKSTKYKNNLSILFVTNYNNSYSYNMRFISQKFKMTMFIRFFGLTKVPMILYCKPTVLHIDSDSVTVKIPLLRRTKNHVGSMYLGALSVGADITSAMLALDIIKNSKKKIIPIFKDFHADFLKRAEGDVHFKCNDGIKIKELISKVISTGNRHSMPINVTAYVPEKNGDNPVATFILTLSLK